MAAATVELGFMGGPMTPDEDTDPYTTKVGGPALFLSEKCQLPKCKGCGKPLKLLLQAYAPLQDPPEDTRQIFVFFCQNKACKSTFHAFRLRLPATGATAATVQTTAEPEKTPSTDKLWDDDWGDDDDNNLFGSGAAPSFGDLEAKLAARDKSLKSPQADTAQTQTTTELAPAPVIVKGDPTSAYFKAFYITSDYEPEAGSVLTQLDKEAQKLLRQYESSRRGCEDDDGDDDKDSGEQYTKYEGDRAFKSFQKRVGRAESQLIRWCHGGEALQVSDQFPLPGGAPPPPPPPPCPMCGAPRVFELQVVPGLMNFLEGGDPDQYDFGTIVVYVCSRDCLTSPATLAEEHIFWHKSL